MSERKLLSEGDNFCTNANQSHDYVVVGEPREYAAVTRQSLYCRKCAEVIEVVVSDERIEF